MSKLLVLLFDEGSITAIDRQFAELSLMSENSIFVPMNLILDDPRPPGPVELHQNTPGTVTVSWAPSPDEQRDDRLHYVVSKRDSYKRTWKTVEDNVFNNKCTVVNILPGREYHFRVFAKNDIGLSPPSKSLAFETKKEKGLCFTFLEFLERVASVDVMSRPKLYLPIIL